MGRTLRMLLAMGWILAAESLIIAGAVLPALVGGSLLLHATDAPPAVRLALVALMLIPGVIVSGVLVLVLSALVCRVMGWRTPRDADLPIEPLEWPLLRWVCYAACTHVANVLVGSWLRASPIWAWYLRANGARIGRGVYVNSTNLSDHNLLELGDGVIIGSGVHLSGHTVEHGHVITGRVRIEDHAVVGIGSVVGIDVVIGARAQIGALSLVPKHARLAGGITYAGVPVRPLDVHSSREKGGQSA